MGFKPVRVTKLPSMDGDALRREPPMESLTDDASELTLLMLPLGLGARSRRRGRCGEMGPEKGCSLRASSANAAALGDSVG